MELELWAWLVARVQAAGYDHVPGRAGTARVLIPISSFEKYSQLSLNGRSE